MFSGINKKILIKCFSKDLLDNKMRTYVKVEGEGVEPIIRKLSKIAVESPEICVWDYNMAVAGWFPHGVIHGLRAEEIAGYFDMSVDDFEKECDKIISSSGSDLEKGTVFFEWNVPPTDEQLRSLEKLIKEVIEPFGNKYTITNQK
jgi:hypothetical protein